MWESAFIYQALSKNSMLNSEKQGLILNNEDPSLTSLIVSKGVKIYSNSLKNINSDNNTEKKKKDYLFDSNLV